MKNKSITILIRHSLFVLTILITNYANAQSLKTFSGSFANGKATYTYYLDEYGNKVKHGNFNYSNSLTVERATVTIKISGAFSDGKRSGKWIFESIGKGSYTKNVMGTSVKYNMNVSQNVRVSYKNGIFNGEFYQRAIQNDYIPDLGQYGYIKSDITTQFVFVNGVVSGKFSIIDKDKDEPQNMTGNVQNGFFDGLISDNGKELLFTNGIMIKNQNWSKLDQDELKEDVKNFQPFFNSTTEEREQNNFTLKEYCSNYPSTFLDKYISKFYNNNDWLHDEIGGDNGYKSTGCFYRIENYNDKLDFTQSEVYNSLEKAKSNNDVFEYLSLYQTISRDFNLYKPSSLKSTNTYYNQLLNELDSILLINNTFIKRLENLENKFEKYYGTTFTEEIINKRVDVTRSKSNFFVKTENGAKMIFCNENGKGFLAPSRCLHFNAVNNFNTELKKIVPTKFNHPTSGKQHQILSTDKIQILFNLELEFEQLEKFFRSIEDTEDLLISKVVALNEGSKKNTFEKSLSDELFTKMNLVMNMNLNADEYLKQLIELSDFLNKSIQLKSRIDGYSKNISLYEAEVGKSRNTIEKMLALFNLNNCKSKQEEFYVLLQKSINQGNSELVKIDEILNLFEKNHLEALEKIKSVISTSDVFNDMSATFLATQFVDKTIAKYAKEIQTLNYENINSAYVNNKNLPDGSGILDITNQFSLDVNQYIEILNKIIALKNKELTKDQIKKINGLKKNMKLLTEELINI